MGERIGLFGGSFDPIHRGHVEAVREAIVKIGLDQVLFLPTARPPHKPGRSLAPAWRRFAMVELALLSYPELKVDAHELTLDTPAYTIDTIEHFTETRPQDEFFLLVGEDSLRDLPAWRRGCEIPERAIVVALRRPGAIEGALPAELSTFQEQGRILRLETAPQPYSSTEIRAALADGDWRSNDPHRVSGLDPRVLDYIDKYELY